MAGSNNDRARVGDMRRALPPAFRLFALAAVCAGSLAAIDRETARFMEQATVKFFCPMPNGYATGSGFVVGDSRHVATNFHVAGAGECYVILGPSQRLPFKMAAQSKQEDLVVVELPQDSGRKPVRAYSSRDTVSKLERVFAMGFPGVADSGPFDLEVKATSGVISAPAHIKGRTLYQTDATIHHGNSGGPLFDECGNLVGINDMVTEGAPGYNYAIQADQLIPLLREAGVSLNSASECNLTPAAAAPVGPDWVTRGLLILAIVMGSAGVVLGVTRRGRQAVKESYGRLTGSYRAYTPPPPPPRPQQQAPPQYQPPPQAPAPYQGGYQGQAAAQPAPQPAAPPLAGAARMLRCLAGPFAGKDVPLSDGVVTLGRDPRYCQLVFNDAPNVSKRHCSLRCDMRAGMVQLEDLGSTNGTYVNAGERLMPGQPRALRARDRFWLGDRSTMFEVL